LLIWSFIYSIYSDKTFNISPGVTQYLGGDYSFAVHVFCLGVNIM